VNSFLSASRTAIDLLLGFDAQLFEIVVLSLEVAFAGLALGSLVGLPLGAAVALFRFPGRGAVEVLLNALMGLPPVVAGVAIYLVLTRTGPLGSLGWLFTPRAMIIAQFTLITPIVAALSRQVVADLWEEYGEQLRSLGVGPARAIPTLLWDGRYRLMTTVLAGFGRAIGEVGAVWIVGGNIAHVTRVMTTSITLETSKGDLPLALALGIILLLIAIAVSAGAALARRAAEALDG
jgi:tungstate transport system permease protein